MLYEKGQTEGILASTRLNSVKQTEIQSVLEGIRNSNEALHKTIEQLTIRLNSVLKEEPESEKAGVQSPFITKLAQSFDEESRRIRCATGKIRKLIDRLEI